MKKMIGLMLFTLGVMSLVVACADKSDNRGGQPFFDVPGGNPFNSFGIYYGRSFGGSLAIDNRHNYREYLDDLLNCNQEIRFFVWDVGNVNNCTQIDNNPRIALNFDTDSASQFGEMQGHLTITVGNNYGPLFSNPQYFTLYQ